MNKFLLSIALFFFCYTAEAKYKTTCPYPEHEIGIGYGYLSTHQAGVLYFSPLASKNIKNITNGDDLSVKMKAIGPFQLNYKYFLQEKLSIGFNIIYSYNQITTQHSSDKELTFDYHTFAITPRFDFFYVRNPKFYFYGNVEVGVNLNVVSDLSPNGLSTKNINVAYQFSPLCFRFGKTIGFVVELGWGTNGVVNGGLGYRHYDRQWVW